MRCSIAALFAIFAVPTMAAEPSGDATIRAAAGKSEIVITTTKRLAGAIHSLTWDGKEFINSTDHGRQLQSACSFDNSPEAGAETFNPTEAGSRDDHVGLNSTSRLLEFSAHGSELKTRTQMAFWLAPGERSEGQLARNTNTLSDIVLTKQVRIGYGNWKQALDYRVTFTVSTNSHFKTAQFEALTGYMPAEFKSFWKFNSATKKLEPLSDGPGEIPEPVVLATADGSHAMGIFSPDRSLKNTTGPTYGRWRFGPEQVVKWNCVFRTLNFTDLLPGEYSYQMLVAVGTLEDVEAMLGEWTSETPAAHGPKRLPDQSRGR